MALKLGDLAPNFTLFNEDLNKISLRDFKGKKNVVILFFPAVNSSTCEEELCSYRDVLHDYQSLDAQVLAISVDSHFALKLWTDKHKFNFPLLSDFNKEISQKYEAFYEIWLPEIFNYKGVAIRSAFVVDKKGIIRYSEVLENAMDLPDHNEIQSTLKKLN